MSEVRSVIPRKPAGEIDLIRSLDDAARVANYVAQSKLFNCSNPAEALVKILAGREMDFGPMAAMASIHIIEGKTSPGADLIAAALRRKGSGYDFDINEISAEICSITFYRYMPDGTKKEIGKLSYTFKQAVENGWNLTASGKEKMTWKQKTANMLFARVITDGKRFFAPDVLTSVYDRDEIESMPGEGSSSSATNYAPLALENSNVVDAEVFPQLTVKDDGSLRSELDDLTEIRNRCEALIRDCGFSHEEARKRLQSGYGVEAVTQINDLTTLRKLETSLNTLKAKRQNGKTAAAATA